MTEIDLKRKIKDVRNELKEINPKHTKKVNEKKEELKELNRQLKKLIDSSPKLTNEVIKAIDSSVEKDNFWDDLSKAKEAFESDINKISDIVEEIKSTMNESIDINSSLYKAMINRYHDDVLIRMSYYGTIKKLLKKAVKRVYKVFKPITLTEQLDTIKSYTKITKKDLYNVLYEYAILGTYTDDDFYRYVNRHMKLR